MKKPETNFKEKVLADLKSLPKTWAEKIQQVAKHGTPDILACVNGHFVAIELKKDAKAKLDQLQLYKLQKIVEAGGTSILAHPGNWQHTLDYIQKKYLKGVPIQGERIAH